MRRTPLVVFGLALFVVVGLLLLRPPEAQPSRSDAHPSATRDTPREEPVKTAELPHSSKTSTVRPVERPVAALDRLLAAIRSGDRDVLRHMLESLLSELRPAPVPDKENAAILYRKAFESMVTMTAEVEAIYIAWDGEHPLTFAEQEMLRGHLEKNGEALRLLHEAVARPRCNFDLKYEDGFAIEMPHILRMIRASKLLRLEGALADGEGAFRSAQAAHRISRALTEEPLLISQLVQNVCTNIAAEPLEQGLNREISPESLRGFLGSLSPEEGRQALQSSMIGEIYIGLLQMLDARRSSVPELAPLRTPDDPLFLHDAEYYVETMREFYDLLDRPYYEIQEQLELLTRTRVVSAPVYAQTSALLVPAIARVARHQAHTEARIQSARIASALKLYRSTHGEYPATLDEVKSLLQKIPVDPFTGHPFSYRREGNGFVVYSFGDDGLDNGGSNKEKDILTRVSQ